MSRGLVHGSSVFPFRWFPVSLSRRSIGGTSSPASKRPRGIWSHATALGDASECRFHFGFGSSCCSLASSREGASKVWSWRGLFRHRDQLSVRKEAVPNLPCQPLLPCLQFTSGVSMHPVSNQPNPPVQLLADPRPISGTTARPCCSSAEPPATL